MSEALPAGQQDPPRPQRDSMELLISAVQELSMARNLESVMAIVRRVARALTAADGATFVLRDGELCHYAEENAIAHSIVQAHQGRIEAHSEEGQGTEMTIEIPLDLEARIGEPAASN